MKDVKIIEKRSDAKRTTKKHIDFDLTYEDVIFDDDDHLEQECSCHGIEVKEEGEPSEYNNNNTALA